MIRLVSIGGTGDAYLVCALAPEVARVHGSKVVVAVPAKYAAIPQMFGQRFELADEEVRIAGADERLKHEYDNRVGDGLTFFAHPCFTRNQRLDDLTVLPRSPSQADMYRALLGLQVGTPLALPRLPDTSPVVNDAILIPDAVSWPNTRPRFWHELEHEMRAVGWVVRVNDPGWPLSELLARCAAAELVVGPQCGVMSILIAARFPCRKVLATPSIDEGPWFNVGHNLLKSTLPYAYASKFDGNDYDIDEHVVTDANYHEIISTILASPRGLRDTRPLTSIEVHLSPGDFLDRLAVLMVKRDRLGPASVGRELARYAAARPSEWDAMLRKMVDLHFTTFDHLEKSVPSALADSRRDDHAAACLNQTRVEMKRQVDDALRGPYREVKSYHRDAAP